MYRYILVLLLLIGLELRIYRIESPLLDHHSWRQSDTADITRNFYREGINPLYPRISSAGNLPGYVASEFPAYNSVVALLCRIFGFHERIGRLVSVAFSIAAAILVYLFATEYFSRTAGLWTVFWFLISPYNIYFSRNFQPESMLVFCSVAGIWFFSRWSRCGRHRELLLSWIFTVLALLIKITALYVFIPIFFLAWIKYHRETFRNPYLYVFVITSLFVSFAWYRHAHNLSLTGGAVFVDVCNGNSVWKLITGTFPGEKPIWFQLKFYQGIFDRLWAGWLTLPGIILVVLGLGTRQDNSRQYLFHVWLAAFLLNIFFTGFASWWHDYYQMPVMPPAAVLSGIACAEYIRPEIFRRILRRKEILTGVLVIGLPVAGFSVYHFTSIIDTMDRMYRLKKNVLEAGRITGRLTPVNALIVSVDDSPPELIYYSGRKGWHVYPGNVSPDLIEGYFSKGAGYVVATSPEKIFSKLTPEFLCRHPVVYSARNEVIIRR